MSNKILYLLYFLSGFSALVYEVTWLRKLELVFGTTTYAVSTIIAVFFTGLAVGAWGFGRLVDRYKLKVQSEKLKVTVSNSKFLKLYGILELGIGIYAVLTPWVFKGIEVVQAYVWSTFEPSFSSFNIATFVLATLGLILPTIFMGGTFPVVAKATVQINADQNADKHGSVGLLYGLNTLGAVVGTLLAGFFLIVTFGVRETILISAVLSLAIGGTAIYMSSKFKPDVRGMK